MKINKMLIKIIILILLNKVDYINSAFLQKSIIKFEQKQKQKQKDKFEKNLKQLIENKSGFKKYIENNLLNVKNLLDIINNKNGSYSFKDKYEDQLSSIIEVIKNNNDLITGYLETLNNNITINNNNNNNDNNNIIQFSSMSSFIYNRKFSTQQQNNQYQDQNQQLQINQEYNEQQSSQIYYQNQDNQYQNQDQNQQVNKNEQIHQLIKNIIYQNKNTIEQAGNNIYLSLMHDDVFFKLSDNLVKSIYLSLIVNEKDINNILNELNLYHNLEDILKLFLISDKIQNPKNYLNQDQEKFNFIEFSQNHLPEINRLFEYIIKNKNIPLDQLKENNKNIIDEAYNYLFNRKKYLINIVINKLINANFQAEFIDKILEMSLNLEMSLDKKVIEQHLNYEFFKNIFEYLKNIENNKQNIKDSFNSIFPYFNLNMIYMDQSFIQNDNQNQQMIQSQIRAPNQKKELEFDKIQYSNKKDGNELEYKSDNEIINNIRIFYTLFQDNSINQSNFDENVVKLIFFDSIVNENSKLLKFNELGKAYPYLVQFRQLIYKYPERKKDNFNFIESVEDFKAREKEFKNEINKYLEVILNPNEVLLKLMAEKFIKNEYLVNIYNKYSELNNNSMRMDLEDIIKGIKLLNDNNFVGFIKLLRGYNTYFSDMLKSKIN